jgi:hypothetical protein
MALLIAEAGLRLWGPFGREYMELDPVLGWRYRPDAPYKFRVIAEAQCGWGSTGRMNSRGLRDVEHGYEKPPGTFRILALGDSFTAAVEHPLEVTWTKLLERRLDTAAEADGLRFEVINAGRGAAGTAYQYLWYLNEGYRYSPDLVILVVTGNDITENSRALSARAGKGWIPDPYYELRDGRLVLDDSFTSTREYRLRQLTMPLRVHSELIRTLLGVRTMLTSSGDPAAARPQPPPGDVASARAVTKRLIGELYARVIDESARFVVFNGLPDYFWGWGDEPDRLLQELVADTPGLFYRDLVEPLDRFTAETGVRAYGCDALGGDGHAGHWSREGHVEVADIIRRALTDFRLVPPVRPATDDH